MRWFPGRNPFPVVFIALLAAATLGHANLGHADDLCVRYAGKAGPGVGKKIILISGDEEYRSEEALPQLGKILATRHGFNCTVLFAIDPESGFINPNYGKNIPGLEALDTADLMVIFTRFRDLPDEQMRHIDTYLKAGKPVIGLRTATHAFKTAEDSKWLHYSNGYAGDQTEWADGFGRLVLGEQWISHHGSHKHESTRGIVAPGAAAHPILRGIAEGSIWGPTDVYGVRLPLPGDSQPLVLGQVVACAGTYDEKDTLYGMRPEDHVPAAEKNEPMMPVAWTKTYELPGGQVGKSFTTTMGASTDLLAEGTRRMLVNAVYWCLGLEEQIPASGAKVEFAGEFKPSQFGFRDVAYWNERKLTPGDFAE